MSLLNKLGELTWAERRLLIEAMIVVPMTRVALTLVPFRLVHRAIAAVLRRQHSHAILPTAGPSAERIAWAVTAVAMRVPGGSCLTQAIAATLLLVRHGHAATLRLGVAKNDDGSLRAHAWVESDGRTILGDPRTEAFVALPPLASHR